MAVAAASARGAESTERPAVIRTENASMPAKDFFHGFLNSIHSHQTQNSIQTAVLILSKIMPEFSYFILIINETTAVYNPESHFTVSFAARKRHAERIGKHAFSRGGAPRPRLFGKPGIGKGRRKTAGSKNGTKICPTGSKNRWGISTCALCSGCRSFP